MLAGVIGVVFVKKIVGVEITPIDEAADDPLAQAFSELQLDCDDVAALSDYSGSRHLASTPNPDVERPTVPGNTMGRFFELTAEGRLSIFPHSRAAVHADLR